MSINVEQATIRTATVEIRALTVNGRQVTQSLFKQLERETLLEVNGTVNGSAWGRVNYRPGDCRSFFYTGAHLHVVWQKGEELRRACVYESHRSINADAYAWLRESRQHLLHIGFLRAVLHEPPTVSTQNGTEIADCGGFRLGPVPYQYAGHVHRLWQPAGNEWEERSVDYSRRCIQEGILKEFDSLSSDLKGRLASAMGGDAALLYHAIEREMAAERHAYEAAYDEIAALPQLFIAV